MNRKTIHREISWLSFNERVLQEAEDPSVPVVERMRFLGIFSNNLDEFFKVRVATIKRMIDIEERTGIRNREKPKEILNHIQKIVIRLQQDFEKTYQKILGELEKENIYLINEKQLEDEQGAFVRAYFQEEVLPVISTVMLHNVHEFPYMKDKSIYLAVKMTSRDPDVDTEYALIEIPTKEVSRFLILPGRKNKKYLILLDDVIRYCLDDVFSIFRFDHFEAYTVKLTRDAELDIDNDLSKSFLEKIAESVSDRSEGQPVRFVFDYSIPRDLLDYFIDNLELDDDDNLIPGGRYHNFKDYMNFPNLGSKKLKYPSMPPNPHPLIKPRKSILALMERRDILMHYPYQRFDSYINLLREASMDPKVTEVKVTLYRVARFSRVINALMNAARNGKKVTVVIELQARFDEKANIYWSKKLEEVGARVIFGMAGLKVHSKLSLITRKDGRKIIRYATIGTGNFHEGTANSYSDLKLLTADKRITFEVEKVFKFFETTFKTYKYKHLLVSPLYQRRRLNALIEQEIKNARAGKPAYIILKANNLVDKDMIKKLYQANSAGVRIQMIVRGICSLIPGVKGLSENITCISIVDKFLEHSRVFIFCNNGDELYYISSADLMTRNLDHRIEVSCPVYDKSVQAEIWKMIELQLRDNVKARVINESLSNEYKKDTGRKRKIRAQVELYRYYGRKYRRERT